MKTTAATLLLFILGALVAAAAAWYASQWKSTSTPAEPATEGEHHHDPHGCCVTCGYTYCDAKQACVRPWAEPLGSPCHRA